MSIAWIFASICEKFSKFQKCCIVSFGLAPPESYLSIWYLSHGFIVIDAFGHSLSVSKIFWAWMDSNYLFRSWCLPLIYLHSLFLVMKIHILNCECPMQPYECISISFTEFRLFSIYETDPVVEEAMVMTMFQYNYFESRKPFYLYLRSIYRIIDLIKDSIFRLYLCIITQCSSSHKVWSADCRSLPHFWWLSEVSQLSLQLYIFEMNLYIIAITLYYICILVERYWLRQHF